MIVPVLLIFGGGVALIAAFASSWGEERSVPNYEPELPPVPGASSGFKKVDAIMGELRKASSSSGIPLGVLVGWIAKESGGRINAMPSKLLKGQTDYERGLFQLHPTESKNLGLDHQRLSTDLEYSINAGLALIGKYMGLASSLDVADKGSPYYWMIVKLAHTMGSGATKIIVNGAKAAGEAGSWDELKKHALNNESKYFSSTKHSPSKWFPLVDKVYVVGKPFGFGGGMSLVGAGPAFTDIPDPLDALRSRS